MSEERTRATRRHKEWAKALRKQRIVRSWNSGEFGEYYDNLHQYADNKIHCSCPLCRAKTTNKGKHKSTYAPSYNPSVKDRKQVENMEYLLAESERNIDEIEENS